MHARSAASPCYGQEAVPRAAASLAARKLLLVDDRQQLAWAGGCSMAAGICMRVPASLRGRAGPC